MSYINKPNWAGDDALMTQVSTMEGLRRTVNSGQITDGKLMEEVLLGAAPEALAKYVQDARALKAKMFAMGERDFRAHNQRLELVRYIDNLQQQQNAGEIRSKIAKDFLRAYPKQEDAPLTPAMRLLRDELQRGAPTGLRVDVVSTADTYLDYLYHTDALVLLSGRATDGKLRYVTAELDLTANTEKLAGQMHGRDLLLMTPDEMVNDTAALARSVAAVLVGRAPGLKWKETAEKQRGPEWKAEQVRNGVREKAAAVVPASVKTAQPKGPQWVMKQTGEQVRQVTDLRLAS